MLKERQLKHVSRLFLCFFFVFVNIFPRFACIAGPQAQTQFFSQHSAAGLLWKGQINANSTETKSIQEC